MSRSAKIRLAFGDGPHDFMLGIAALEELQEKTDCGPEALYKRLGDGTWRTPADIREPLRLGLIGGGMKPLDALVLVERYAGPAWLLDAKVPAQAVIAAALIGAVDEDPKPSGETKATRPTAARRSKTANGGSPTYTPAAG